MSEMGVENRLAEIVINVNRIANEMQTLRPFADIARELQLEFQSYKSRQEEILRIIESLPDRVQDLEMDAQRSESHIEAYPRHCEDLSTIKTKLVSHDTRLVSLEDDRKRLAWSVIEKVLVAAMAAIAFYAVLSQRGVVP